MAIALYTFLFCVNYSPLFRDCFAAFQEGSAIECLVIGKYWDFHFIPYGDIFGSSGPLVYLMSSISWCLGLRTGGFLLQILIFGFILTSVYAMISENYKRSEAYIGVLGVSALLICTCAYGDMEAELSLLAAVLVLRVSKKFGNKRYVGLLWGIGVGLALLVNIRTAIVCLFICLAFEFGVFSGSRKRMKSILLFLLGVIGILSPVLLYFGVQHALDDLVLAYIMQANHMLEGFASLNEIVRKLIKCVPIFIYLLLGIVSAIKKEAGAKWHLITGIGLFCATFFSDVTWNKCIYIIWALMLSLYLIVKIDTSGKRYVLFFITLVIGVGIFVKPTVSFLGKYMDYCLSGDYKEVRNDFIELIDNACEEELTEILMIDLPAEYYLYLDLKPSYFLFTKQSEYSYYYSDFSLGISDYVDTADIPLICMDGNQWLPFEIGSYSMTQIETLDKAVAIFQYEAE